MNPIRSVVVLTALAFVVPADAATTDPERTIYFVPGVIDNGGGVNSGVATVFHCTIASGVPENVRITVRDATGDVVANKVFSLSSQNTWTASTHGTLLFIDNNLLSPGVAITQGYAVIRATSTNVFCSAMIVSASATSPTGIALHMVRKNPSAGTEE